MRQKTERHQDAAKHTIKDIRRQTRKRYSSEGKIRIVLAGLRGEDSIAGLGAFGGVLRQQDLVCRLGIRLTPESQLHRSASSTQIRG
jgi:hypothetical protein